MKELTNQKWAAQEGWKENVRFLRPSSALKRLRKEMPTWYASILKPPDDGSTEYCNRDDDDALPEILVEAAKSCKPIRCRSKLLLACLMWLEQDPHVVSYDQLSEVICLDYDGVEYPIHADLRVDCKDGDAWLINLIDSRTEELFKSMPVLLESVEVFCESNNCTYFPVRQVEMFSWLLIEHAQRIDDSEYFKIHASSC